MSGWYLDGKESLLARTIPPEALVYVLGVNEDYEFNEAHDNFDVFTPHVILPELELNNVTFDDGIMKADNPKWAAAGAGIEDRSLELQGVVIYFKLDDAGSLLAFIDSAVAGLPQTLTGVNVTGRWHPSGILKL